MVMTQDLHVHTHLSKCSKPAATAEAYIESAVKLGLETIAITDHMWDHDNLPYDVDGDEFSDRTKQWGKTYRVTTADYCLGVKDEFAAIDCKGVRVLYGCECEYDYLRRRPAITLETAKRFDMIIVPNSHTHLTMPDSFYSDYDQHIQFMIDAFYDTVNSDVAPYVTAMAHPFDAVCCYYDRNILYNRMTEKQYADCFDAAKKKNIAIEINLSNYPGKTKEEILQGGDIRMLRIAKEAGCIFTFGTDAHLPESQIAAFPYSEVLADILNLSDSDILKL